MGAGALALEASRAVVEPKEEVSPDIVDTVEAMQTAEYGDALMDCLNEDILKDALGFRMGSFEECQNERILAATRAADVPNTLFPEATPIPGAGS